MTKKQEDNSCVFCDHSNIKDIESLGDGVSVFTPLNPVVPSHKVFISDIHSTDASDNIDEFAKVARAVALYARGEFDDYNIITSKGVSATQSVFHMHIHLVPRFEDDGLKLPWTNQKKVNPTSLNIDEKDVKREIRGRYE